MTQLIATSQLTLTNVDDGQSSYTHIAYVNMTQLATENSSFTLSVRSTVRYGKDANWFYKTFDAGTYTATNATFGGDTYPSIFKVAELVDGFSTSNSAEKAYIGVYVDFNSADSTNPADYNWTLIKGSDGAMGTPGTPGEDGRTPYVHTAWANNATGTSGFSLDNSTDKLYIGIYTDFEPADSTDPTKYKWTLIKGEKGDKGTDGVAGKDGVGIKSTVITYGLSASDSTQPSTWTTTVPNLVKGQYLWTKTVWTYSDNTTETGYVKTYIAKDGNNGNDGVAGKDGVGIKATVITYAHSTSGTSAPTSGWTSAVPTVPAGEFLWTKTVWIYTDNTTETGYSVAKMGENGTGHLTTWTFYKLSNSTSAPQVVPIGASTNLSHLGPNNAWAPFKELSGGTAGWGVIDFDKIAKSNIIPDKPFTWYLEASFDGVSNFNGSTDFNIRFENWYVNSSGSTVFNPLGTKDFQANKFSATNDTNVNNHFIQSVTWTVPKAVYDAIPEGGFLNLRISIDRFTKLFYHAKNSYVTYGTVPSAPAQRGLGNYSTYGWKASPETVTQELPYLWIYQIQFYDNGREVAIPPTLIGTQGADGKTPYVHFAYSDNADGTDLTTSDKGQRYIGHYSDYTQADSTDKTKYRWADRWAKIDSGGRNYFKNSRSREYIITAGTIQDFRTFIYDEFWKNDKRFIKSMVRISLDVTFSPALPQDISTTVHFSASPWYGAPITFKGGTTGRQHFDLVYDLSGATNTYKTDNVFIRFNNSFPLNTRVSIDNANLYISSVREDYRPAVEELDEAFDSKADQALTQQQLNMLIEKAQLMQTELEAKVAMETLSDLERAYNAYVEANNKAVAKSQADLIEAGRRVDAMVETLGGLSKTKTFIDTYIKEANEGIIIGTKDNVSQIRITYDRIAMYSAGKEVMYISQGVIHIDNGVFTKSLQIGRFRTEQHQTNLDINVCRYVG